MIYYMLSCSRAAYCVLLYKVYSSLVSLCLDVSRCQTWRKQHAIYNTKREQKYRKYAAIILYTKHFVSHVLTLGVRVCQKSRKYISWNVHVIWNMNCMCSVWHDRYVLWVHPYYISKAHRQELIVKGHCQGL